ncbi:MAG TPA: urease accessory protein UreE [Candidatus Binatia bacterium]
MHGASIHRPAAHWPKDKATGTLTLDFDARHHRRIRLTADQDEDVLLDLPRAIAMTDGDELQLEDGKWLKVRAAAELVVEVSHRDPNKLARLAWHLGNRHLPTEIRDQVLRIRPDHVIEKMLHGFGANRKLCHREGRIRKVEFVATGREKAVIRMASRPRSLSVWEPKERMSKHEYGGVLIFDWIIEA